MVSQAVSVWPTWLRILYCLRFGFHIWKKVETCYTKQEAVFGKGSLECIRFSNQPSKLSNYAPAQNGRRKKQQNKPNGKEKWIGSNKADSCLQLKRNLLWSYSVVTVCEPKVVIRNYKHQPSVTVWAVMVSAIGQDAWEESRSLFWRFKIFPSPYSLNFSCFHLMCHWWEPSTSKTALKLEG